MNNKKLSRKFLIYSIPYFGGLFLLFLYPLWKVVYYSMIKNTRTGKFNGFNNYIELVQNRYFCLALKNTLLFVFIGVCVLLIVSTVLAVFFREVVRGIFPALFLVIPLLIPTSSVLEIWHQIFPVNIYHMAAESNGKAYLMHMLPVYAMYLWKNIGVVVCVILIAFSRISGEVEEAARLETKRKGVLYRYILFPMIKKELFAVAAFAVYQALKNFQDSYLFYETYYPPETVYTLQYFLNNQFLKMNYPVLAAATVLMLVVFIVLCRCGMIIVSFFERQSMKERAHRRNR